MYLKIKEQVQKVNILAGSSKYGKVIVMYAQNIFKQWA